MYKVYGIGISCGLRAWKFHLSLRQGFHFMPVRIHNLLRWTTCNNFIKDSWWEKATPVVTFISGHETGSLAVRMSFLYVALDGSSIPVLTYEPRFHSNHCTKLSYSVVKITESAQKGWLDHVSPSQNPSHI